MLKLKAQQLYDIVDDYTTVMEWYTIVRKLKTKYRSLKYQNLWSTKDKNTKANANDIAGLHAKVNKLTPQVRVQDPGRYGRKCWTNVWDHVQANCPRKTPEEQPHGNGFQLDPERMGPKWRKECLGTTVVNDVSGPQVPRITAPPLIFAEQSHWITNKGTIILLFLLRLLIILMGILPNIYQPIVLTNVSI